MIINSVAPLREGGPQKQIGLPVNVVGKVERPFEKSAVVVVVLPNEPPNLKGTSPAIAADILGT